MLQLQFNNRVALSSCNRQGYRPGGTPIPPDPGSPVIKVHSNPMLRLNMVYKKYDDSWSMPQTVIEAWSGSPLFKTMDLAEQVESIAVADSSTMPESMFVAMYMGYTAGNATDGAADQYAFLKTAMIDKNFNVTALFPNRGYVPSIGTRKEIKAPHVLRVGRLFAQDNKGRFQFKVPELSIALKSVESHRPHQELDNWNFEERQVSIVSPSRGDDVTYDKSTGEVFFKSKISAVFSKPPDVTFSITAFDSETQDRYKLEMVLPANQTTGYETLLNGSRIQVLSGSQFSGGGRCRVSLISSRTNGYVGSGLLSYFLRDTYDAHHCTLGLPDANGFISISSRLCT